MLIYYMLLLYIMIVSAMYQICVSGSSRLRYHKSVYFWFVFIPVWLIMGLRYGVGKDYFSYKNIFEEIGNGVTFSYIERGYVVLNRLINRLTHKSAYLFLTTSFMIVFFFMKTIWKYSRSVVLSSVLFITLGYYFNAMNAVRQFMAISISFYAIQYINRKDWFKFLTAILIASTFHTSALILLVSYIAIVFLKDKTFYVLSTTAFLLIRIMDMVLLKVISGNFWMNKFAMNNVTESRLSFPNLILGFTIFVAGHLVLKKKKMGREIVTYMKYNWIALLCFLFLYNWGTACTRIAFYYTPVYLLLIPEIIVSIKGISNRLIVQMTVVVICGFYLVNMLTHSVMTGNNFIPYMTVFSE